VPDITDLETVRFVREQIRPLCERARALKAEVSAMKIKYQQQIDASGSQYNLAGNTDIVTENRTSEGVANLTKLQVTQAFGQLDVVTTLNDGIISAPCVRPLEAS